jgi:hypothetical protein
MFNQDDKQSKRLLLKPDAPALFQQFAGRGVRFERAKSIDSPGRRLHGSTSRGLNVISGVSSSGF